MLLLMCFVQVCAFVVVTAVVVVVCVFACVSFVRARLVRYVVGLVVCAVGLVARAADTYAICGASSEQQRGEIEHTQEVSLRSRSQNCSETQVATRSQSSTLLKYGNQSKFCSSKVT